MASIDDSLLERLAWIYCPGHGGIERQIFNVLASRVPVGTHIVDKGDIFETID